MAANSGKFYIGTDTRITLVGLQNEEGVYLDGTATITAKMQDADGNVLVHGDNIPFSHKAGSNGDFIAYLPYNLPMEPKVTYTLVISILAGNGRRMQINVPRQAVYVAG